MMNRSRFTHEDEQSGGIVYDAGYNEWTLGLRLQLRRTWQVRGWAIYDAGYKFAFTVRYPGFVQGFAGQAFFYEKNSGRT
jgi:hypothetical protein